MNEKSQTGIHESLHELAFPLEDLETLPGNPRRGNVEAVVKSYEQFGQRKPIVGRMKPDGKGVILAGNTQLKAARQMGWSHIAVLFVDDDDSKAAAFAIADNRTHDLGEYDDEALYEMLDQIRAEDDLLVASGYDLVELAELEAKIDGLVDDVLDDPYQTEEQEAPERPTPTPVISATIVFTTEAQQSRWHRFLRWLKSEYPEVDTLSERIDEFLTDQGIQ